MEKVTIRLFFLQLYFSLLSFSSLLFSQVIGEFTVDNISYNFASFLGPFLSALLDRANNARSK